MGGILGNLEPPSPLFPRVREHPLVKGEGVWCPFSESRRVPDAVIDELAGNGISYAANKSVARELVRTAVRNFDALHFQAILDDRSPAAYQAALRKSKPRLKKMALHAKHCAEQLRQLSPRHPDLLVLEKYATDSRMALLGQKPPIEKAGRSGRKQRDLSRLLFKFLILFRQEVGGSTPSATWRRQGANEYRDTRFATTVANLLKHLPRLSKSSSLPDHLRVPLSTKTIASLIAELEYPRRTKRASRRRSERREIHLKTA